MSSDDDDSNHATRIADQRFDSDGNMMWTACNVCGVPCEPTLLSSMGRCLSCIREANANHNRGIELKGERVTDETLEVVEKQRVQADPTLRRFRHGGAFILDTAPDPEPIWGDGDEVLWAEGESLVIVGPQGTGKSTIAQQLALARASITDDEVLGYGVKPSGRVLYLAMDRPQQIARSFARMVDEDDRDLLDEYLVVWTGPPLYDMAKDTGLLARMAELAFAPTIVVDSIKDAAIGLSDDAVGSGWNRARQTALSAGYQVVELHHQRKVPQDQPKREPSIDDVYGSTWITAGAGSVILLTGRPGDPIVGMHHIKQPAEPVGPLQLIHDHGAGRTTVFHATDLLALARRPQGITAVEAACALFNTEKPTPNEKEKARRRLANLTASGALRLIDPGDKLTNTPARWAPPSVAVLDGP